MIRVKMLLVAIAILLVVSCGSEDDAESSWRDAGDYINAGDYKSAIILLKGLVVKDDTNTSYRAALGEAYFNIHEYELAIKELDRARSAGALADKYSGIYLKSLERLGRYAVVIKMEPVESDQFRVSRIKSLVALDELSRASEYFNADVYENSNYKNIAQAYIDLGSKKVESGYSSVVKAEQLGIVDADLKMFKGNLQLQLNKFGDAIETYKEAQELGFDPLVALFSISRAYLLQGDVLKVQEYISKLEAVNKEFPALLLTKAWVLSAQKQYRKSYELLQEYRGKFQVESDFHMIFSKVAFAVGDLEQALQSTEYLVLNFPKNLEYKKLELMISKILGTNADSLVSTLHGDAAQEIAKDSAFLDALGDLAFSRGEYQLSEMLFTDSLSATEDEIVAVKLAASKVKLGDLDSALEILNRYSDNNVFVVTALTMGLINQGRFDEAKSLIGRLESEDRFEHIANLMHVEYDISRNEYQSALSRLSSVDDTKVYPEYLRIKKASILSMLGKHEDALQVIMNNGKLAEVALPGLVTLYNIEVGSKNQSLANNIRDEILKRFPDSNFSIDYKLGKLIGDSNYADALVLLDSRKYFSDDYLKSKRLRGRLLASLGRYSDSLMEFKTVLDVFPEDKYSNYYSGVVFEMLGNSVGAYNSYKLSASEEVPYSLYKAVISSLSNNKISEARIYLDRLSAVLKDEKISYLYDASIAVLLAEGDFVSAESSAETNFEAYQNSFNLIKLTSIQYRNGDLSKAILQLRNWLDKYPADNTIINRLAYFYMLNGNSALALEWYKKLPTLDQDVVSLNNVALLLMKLDKNTEGLEFAKQAYDLAPGNGAVQHTYGLALLGAGDYLQANRLLKAAAASLDSLDSQYHLALSYFHLQQPDLARPILETALAKGGFSLRAEAEALLSRLN